MVEVVVEGWSKSGTLLFEDCWVQILKQRRSKIMDENVSTAVQLFKVEEFNAYSYCGLGSWADFVKVLIVLIDSFCSGKLNKSFIQLTKLISWTSPGLGSINYGLSDVQKRKMTAIISHKNIALIYKTYFEK